MHAKRSVSLGGLLAVALAVAPASAQCTAPASWFPHAQTPAPDPSDPAFAQSNVDPCRFHQWSWQTFLRLTQTVDGDLRFIKEMYSDDNLFDLETIERKYSGRLPDWGHRPRRTFTVRPRDTKPTTIRGEPQIGQAGDNGILVDQRGHAVYYAIHINQTYYDFIAGRQYYRPEKLRDAPPIDQFPVGTLELKSSWRLLDDDEDRSGFYTTKAQIEPLKTVYQGQRSTVIVEEKPSHYETRTVALVGLHVVGVVQGHPSSSGRHSSTGGMPPCSRLGYRSPRRTRSAPRGGPSTRPARRPRPSTSQTTAR